MVTKGLFDEYDGNEDFMTLGTIVDSIDLDDYWEYTLNQLEEYIVDAFDAPDEEDVCDEPQDHRMLN